MTDGFDRAEERPNYSKAFAYRSEQVTGTSNGEKLKKSQAYNDANYAY